MRTLLGDRVDEVRVERKALTVDRFGTPEAFRDYFKDNYGPTIAVYRSLAGDAARASALDTDLADLARRHDRGEGTMDWEYLLVVARKRLEPS